MGDEVAVDLETVKMQVQQFLDEWHYRVMHSRVAVAWDRSAAVKTALRLISMHGVNLSEHEVETLANMPREDEMVEYLVSRMPKHSQSTFEHFALQLQLIVSTATCVRRGLEDYSAATTKEDMARAAKEAARAFEGNDNTGITAQILKQAVMVAGREVHDLRERHESWGENTKSRVTRLGHSADQAASAASQLAAIQGQLDEFGGQQNQKSKAVLMGVAANQDKALCQTIFSSWLGHFVKYKAEKSIHDKFRAQIENAERKLIEYKQNAMSNVRNVLMRKAGENDAALCQQIFNTWNSDVQDKKNEGGNMEALKAAQAKLAGYKADQAENTKRVMMRMNAGSDASLLNLCLQSWTSYIEEYKKNKEFEDKVKAAEKQVQDFLKKKSEEARGVLDRMSAGSDTGLISLVFGTWSKDFLEEKKARELLEQYEGGAGKFATQTARQRASANGVVARANRQVEMTILSKFFNAWGEDAKVEHTIKAYDRKIGDKAQKLKTVQDMFTNFAKTLDTSLTDSPRGGELTKKSSQRR